MILAEVDDMDVLLSLHHQGLHRNTFYFLTIFVLTFDGQNYTKFTIKCVQNT